MPPFGFTNDGLVPVKIIKSANWNRGKEKKDGKIQTIEDIFRK
jgi:hypothetical protein